MRAPCAAIRPLIARPSLGGEALGQNARAALRAFDVHAYPGVPTVVIEGGRFFGKDRLDWIKVACDQANVAQRHDGFLNGE